MITAVNDSLPGPDLNGMTKTELLAYADEAGVTGLSSRMRKAEIIEALEG